MEASGKGLKSFIAVVLVLGLLLGQQQIQVEANICCPSTQARNMYDRCLTHEMPESFCEAMSGCKVVHGKCNDYPYSDSTDDAMALQFCKLGCASSACDNNIKEASDAVDRCDEACYRFCTKHVHTAAGAATAAS